MYDILLIMSFSSNLNHNMLQNSWQLHIKLGNSSVKYTSKSNLLLQERLYKELIFMQNTWFKGYAIIFSHLDYSLHFFPLAFACIIIY